MTDIMGRSTAAHLEPWRDARRIPEQYSADAPATFEWWYVDAQLTGGRTVVAAFVVEPDTAHQRFAYRTQVFVMRADGPRRTLSHRTYDDVAISAERPDIRIGQSSLRGDGDTYRLVIDPANHAGFGLDVVITGAVPGRVAPDGTDVILGGEDGFGWVNAVPRGNLAGTMTENGQNNGDPRHRLPRPQLGHGDHGQRVPALDLGPCRDRAVHGRVSEHRADLGLSHRR